MYIYIYMDYKCTYIGQYSAIHGVIKGTSAEPPPEVGTCVTRGPARTHACAPGRNQVPGCPP